MFKGRVITEIKLFKVRILYREKNRVKIANIKIIAFLYSKNKSC